MLQSAVTGSERTLAPGVDVVLEVVRMAVNEQFPTLMPTLYPGSMATDPKPYASLDKMWKAFGDMENNKKPAVKGKKFPAVDAICVVTGRRHKVSPCRSAYYASPW